MPAITSNKLSQAPQARGVNFEHPNVLITWVVADGRLLAKESYGEQGGEERLRSLARGRNAVRFYSASNVG